MKEKELLMPFVIVRQMQKNFRVKTEAVIRRAMGKLAGEEWLVSAVTSTYTSEKTVVRTVYGNSGGFKVKAGMQHGSAMSPLLLMIVMEAISREFGVALPCEQLYADDLVVVA